MPFLVYTAKDGIFVYPEGIMKKFLPTLALLAIALTACSPIKSGTIIEKDYDPPYQSTYMMCGMYDSKGMCSMWMPMTDQHPESFNLKLQEGEDTGWRSVTKGTYESHEIGSYISFDN